jgi:hypothetical protein
MPKLNIHPRILFIAQDADGSIHGYSKRPILKSGDWTGGNHFYIGQRKAHPMPIPIIQGLPYEDILQKAFGDIDYA